MAFTSDPDDLIRAGAQALVDDFPQIELTRIAQALARAKLEINTGYQVLKLAPPTPHAYASEVLGLARQELERATDTEGRSRALNV
jgi:hypothetical protein